MNTSLEQAISIATATLSEEGQSKLARFIIDEAKRLSILEAVAKADANPDAGIPHEEVCKWLESWGTENELPPPTCKPS
jgi:predicted transcriptional regulator